MTVLAIHCALDDTAIRLAHSLERKAAQVIGSKTPELFRQFGDNLEDSR